MGCATAEGTDRALRAAQGAINSPLLNDSDIRGAKKVLVNITTGTAQVTMDEIGEIMEYVQEAAGSTDIILGACDDPSIGEKLSVTIIATGFESGRKPAYSEQKVVKVYELNDTPVVNETTPVVEVTEQPVVKFELPETVLEEQPVVNLQLEDEDKFTLFDTTTAETESENVIEFEVSRKEQQLPEVNLVEEVTEVKMDTTVEPVAEQVEKKEDYVIYTKKSYESDSVVSFPQEELNKQLEDRKKILAGLSYRFGNKQNVNELENEPAYKRKGVEVNAEQNFSKINDNSRFSVGDTGGDRPEIKKNNSFLHDNVD